ncbi:sensor histidine kinase [Plebeiibacterium marinum]|uniref:histidine kinase n=1 Tax=Plebeiibacterium marinum TaxID=2992111 RepID=A0AAE3SLC0_9BACT|nr:HAMP domain-containing sensor histidine kinase [Plebeiobacterium marinum]MCW3807443.1 HAMP domain-containing histidine kinase [Plebeiobacterium marinum]
MKELKLINHSEVISNHQFSKQIEIKEKKIIADNKKLIAIIGHDIKSPMSSMISFLGLLKEGAFEWNRNKVEEYIEIALKSAEQTMKLLDGILIWALAENYNNSFQPEIIDLKEILIEETNNLELFASLKDIKITLPVFSEIKLFADKNMVKSILRNLISNAIKYSHANGKIDISTLSKNNRFLEVTIKDYGVGMEHEVSNILFESGKNNSLPGTNSETGTAFGLSLCKEFIDIHNGKIWIISKPGKGSEFKFTLPLGKP